MARAAKDQLLSRSKRPHPRTRVDVPITARAPVRPSRDLPRAGTHPRRWLCWDPSGFFPAANGPSRAREAASRSLPGPLYGPSRDLPGVQPPRTCVDLSIKRGVQPPLRGATRPVRPRTACRRCVCKCPPAGSAPGGCPSEPPGPGPAPESGRRSSGW